MWVYTIYFLLPGSGSMFPEVDPAKWGGSTEEGVTSLPVSPVVVVVLEVDDDNPQPPTQGDHVDHQV